jgi:hypothetical protein
MAPLALRKYRPVLVLLGLFVVVAVMLFFVAFGGRGEDGSEGDQTAADVLGQGLFVFASATDPTVTDGSSSGGNPLIPWSRLEPKDGDYNWNELDDAIDQARRSGTKIVPRIVTNFSIFGQATPDWYFDLPNAEHYYPHEAAKDDGYKAPVAWDPVYKQKFGEFLKALGKRYDGNPAIEFFQIASSGVYGELYLGSELPDDYSVDNHKEAIEYWTDAWRDAFPNTHLSIMLNGLGNDVGQDAASHAVSKGYYLQMNSPVGHPATRALLKEFDQDTKIVIEAENGGCRDATGSAFTDLMDTLFGFGYHVDYVTLCPQTFTDASSAAVLQEVWDRLPGSSNEAGE